MTEEEGKLNCREKCPFSCYEEAYHAVQIDGDGLKQLFMDSGERELVARVQSNLYCRYSHVGMGY